MRALGASAAEGRHGSLVAARSSKLTALPSGTLVHRWGRVGGGRRPTPVASLRDARVPDVHLAARNVALGASLGERWQVAAGARGHFRRVRVRVAGSIHQRAAWLPGRRDRHSGRLRAPARDGVAAVRPRLFRRIPGPSAPAAPHTMRLLRGTSSFLATALAYLQGKSCKHGKGDGQQVRESRLNRLPALAGRG